MKNFIFNIQLFAEGTTIVNTNTTTGVTNAQNTITATTDLAPTMKEFYDTELLENTRSDLIYSQFAKHYTLPTGSGKIIEWRKYETLPPALKPLTEGVTPVGRTAKMSRVRAEVSQYGDYSTFSDVLKMTAVDDIIAEATTEHGAQAALTMNILTRNSLMRGTNIMYAGSALSKSDIDTSDEFKLTADYVNKIKTKLKADKAKTVNGKYIMIVHPYVAYDLRKDPEWLDAHKYAHPQEIYNGEIGQLHGIRFIEDTEAPVFAGKAGYAAYGCFAFGIEAYGDVALNGNVEMFAKQLGSGGTADPLNQRSTVGWKGNHVSRILYPERIITFICGSSYSQSDVEGQINYTYSVGGGYGVDDIAKDEYIEA